MSTKLLLIKQASAKLAEQKEIIASTKEENAKLKKEISELTKIIKNKDDVIQTKDKRESAEKLADFMIEKNHISPDSRAKKVAELIASNDTVEDIEKMASWVSGLNRQPEPIGTIEGSGNGTTKTAEEQYIEAMNN